MQRSAAPNTPFLKGMFSSEIMFEIKHYCGRGFEINLVINLSFEFNLLFDNVFEFN